MKKCYSLLRWPAYYRMCSTDVYCSKQTGSSSTKKTITHHFFVSGIGRRKLSMQPKFVAAQKMFRNRNQQTFVNGLLGFITLGIALRWKRVCVLTIIAWVAHRYGQLPSALLINVCFWVPSSCFCIVISLSEGEIIPFSGVCQSGRLHYPRRRRCCFTQWQTALMCNRRRPAAASSRRASFSALASANSFIVFCIERSNITLTHLHIGNCRVRQLQFSGIFVSAGLCR